MRPRGVDLGGKLLAKGVKKGGLGLGHLLVQHAPPSPHFSPPRAFAMPSELRNILIIGASSAGAPLARALEKKLPATHRVVLVDAQVSSRLSLITARCRVSHTLSSEGFLVLPDRCPARERRPRLVRLCLPLSTVASGPLTRISLRSQGGQGLRRALDLLPLSVAACCPTEHARRSAWGRFRHCRP